MMEYEARFEIRQYPLLFVMLFLPMKEKWSEEDGAMVYYKKFLNTVLVYRYILYGKGVQLIDFSEEWNKRKLTSTKE